MSTDRLQSVRQYSFASGPNYTDSPFTLADTECAESDNFYHDGLLRTIPGAARLITTAMSHAVVGLFQYHKADGTAYFLAASAGGRLAYQDSTTWVNVSTGLPSTANTFYDWVVFNDTLVVLSGSTPKQWDGTTFDDLGGTPPNSRFGEVHGDYVLLAGHTSAPSQIRYSDTSLLQTWPAGNTLNIGLDDGQIITGLQRFGDATVIFKERSIYLLSGSSSADFAVNPTLSDVGCISPDSIVFTDLGIFFWSEAGPAIFNGFKTVLLNRRLRGLLDTVDWDAPLKISAAYYPYRKHVLVSYQRTGQSTPDRALLFDLYRLGDDRSPTVFWPLTHGWTAATDATDSVGRKRVYFGHSNGYVTTYDSGTTFNGATITPRLRSRALFPERLDTMYGLRRMDTWHGGTTGRVSAKLSCDGATFVAHGQSPKTLTGRTVANSTLASLDHVRWDGDGSGSLKIGRALQVEFSIPGATPISIHGVEVAFEPLGTRTTA